MAMTSGSGKANSPAFRSEKVSPAVVLEPVFGVSTRRARRAGERAVVLRMEEGAGARRFGRDWAEAAEAMMARPEQRVQSSAEAAEEMGAMRGLAVALTLYLVVAVIALGSLLAWRMWR